MASKISPYTLDRTPDTGRLILAVRKRQSGNRVVVVGQFGYHSVAKPSSVCETSGMKRPELTDMAWLGPKEEMDRASHRFGKCSECHEIICVEKAVTDGPSTQGKTSEMLYEAFRAHVKLKHSEDFNYPSHRTAPGLSHDHRQWQMSLRPEARLHGSCP